MKGTAANIAAHRIQACLCDLERSIDEDMGFVGFIDRQSGV